ncbi:MAG: condensation domain-containing protein [Polyangiaceae bacterium]
MMDLSAAHKLVKRLAALEPERRASFWKALREQNVDFSAFPIPEGLGRAREGTLSHAQERLWFLQQLDSSSSTYNIASATRLVGTLDPAALQRALVALAERHAVLRTRFTNDEGRAAARVDASSAIELAQRDLSLETPARRVALANAMTVEEARRPFDLARAPLLRATLVKLGTEEHLFLLTMHHVVSDGWSMNLVVEELASLYDGFRTARQVSLPELPIQYEDYALWQRIWLEAGEYDRQLGYWKTALAGDVPALDLPKRPARPTSPANEGKRHLVTIEQELARQLQRLANENGTTLFVVLLAAFQVLLYRHSGQRDVRVGVPVANRERAEVQRLIGLFVNTVVVRGTIFGHRRFAELVRETKNVVLEARAHSDVPFDRVVDALNPDRTGETSALFQVMFNHQRRDYRPLANLFGLRWSPWEGSSAPAPFELCLDTEEREEGELLATFTYAVDVFEDVTVERLARDWLEILATVTARPHERIAELAPLDEAEFSARASRNVPMRRYARDLPVHGFIARHAAATPDKEAVECQGVRITYADLERRANQVANALRARGVTSESIVAIGVARSLDMIVGLLGIMKSGAAYVPLDPTYPVDRLRYMIEDSGARVIVGQRGVLDELRDGAGLRSVLLDSDEVKTASPSAPRVAIHPESAAYVIYTSGSTGRPKGVVVPHGALVMHLQAIADAYAMTSSDTMLEFASISFDGAVDQWMAPLMLGARVVVRGVAPGTGRLDLTFTTAQQSASASLFVIVTSAPPTP